MFTAKQLAELNFSLKNKINNFRMFWFCFRYLYF